MTSGDAEAACPACGATEFPERIEGLEVECPRCHGLNRLQLLADGDVKYIEVSTGAFLRDERWAVAAQDRGGLVAAA